MYKNDLIRAIGSGKLPEVARLLSNNQLSAQFFANPNNALEAMQHAIQYSKHYSVARLLKPFVKNIDSCAELIAQIPPLPKSNRDFLLEACQKGNLNIVKRQIGFNAIKTKCRDEQNYALNALVAALEYEVHNKPEIAQHEPYHVARFLMQQSLFNQKSSCVEAAKRIPAINTSMPTKETDANKNTAFTPYRNHILERKLKPTNPAYNSSENVSELINQFKSVSLKN